MAVIPSSDKLRRPLAASAVSGFPRQFLPYSPAERSAGYVDNVAQVGSGISLRVNQFLNGINGEGRDWILSSAQEKPPHC